MERLLELHRKIRSKLCKEIFFHSLAVIVFSGLVIVSIVEVLKLKDPDGKKVLAALLGITHFGLCSTAILHLKWCGVMEMNPTKCRIWIYLEVYNIGATTAFIVLATRHFLPAPFHQWTGTALLLIIYWLPLIMYKTSQLCRMLEFINILNYFTSSSHSQRKHLCNNSDHMPAASTQKQGNVMPCPSDTHIHSTLPCQVAITRGKIASNEVRVNPPNLKMSNPLTAASPQMPYEWALIDSISGAMP